VAYVRPYEIRRSLNGVGFDMQVERVAAQGPVLTVEGAAADGQRIEAAFSRSEVEIEPGASLRLIPDRAYVFPVGR
jgi:hypothetical protein